MKKEEIERKIKGCDWNIDDCRRYISELLTKEESGKIDTGYATEQLKKTRKQLAEWKEYREKLKTKLVQQGI